VPEFFGEDPQFASRCRTWWRPISSARACSEPLDRASFIDRPRDSTLPPRFQDWRVINAQAVVVAAGRALGWPWWASSACGTCSRADSCLAAIASARRSGAGSAHLIADQVYQRLTGEKGYFDTQIVFIDETGPKDKRNKRLAMMDQDGANVRLLSQGRELVLPRASAPPPRKSPSCSTPATSRACSS
jgi:TolB protein